MPSLNNIFIPDVIIIDSMNISKRYHHALQLVDVNGVPMGAPYGVLKYVHSLQKKYPSCEFIFLWEGKTSFRKTLYPEYKAKRRKSSDDPFYASATVLKKALSCLGIKQVYYPGMEADDLAGYYCAVYSACNVLLISNDYDWFQYVSDNVRLQMRDNIVYNKDDAFDKLGFPPGNITLYKTLTGDSSDNIKGISRFPKKLAIYLCQCAKDLSDLKNKKLWSVSKFSELSEKTLNKWYSEIIKQWSHVEFVYGLIKYNASLIDCKNIRAIKSHDNRHAFKLLLLKHNMKNLVKIYEG